MKLPTWQALSDADLRRAWALSLMVLNLSTGKHACAVRLPAGDLPTVKGDAAKAGRLLRNLARRLEQQAPGVSASILEGLDEILTVIRPGLPYLLRRSLACSNAIDNAIGTVRTISRNVKRWRNAETALRWTAAGLGEAQKSFRRRKA